MISFVDNPTETSLFASTRRRDRAPPLAWRISARRPPRTLTDADSDVKRTDNFNFRQVRISGNIAYAVYFLKSQTDDSKNGKREREWLESAILRRSRSGWKIALLHSTRIENAAA